MKYLWNIIYLWNIEYYTIYDINGIFDINGKHIKTLINNQVLQSGHHEYSLQSQKLDLSSSIYMYKIETDKWNSTKKMLLLK